MTIAQLIQQERLPADFTDTVDRYYRPLADRVAESSAGKPTLLGINGGQGTGKSTMALFLSHLLAEEHGLNGDLIGAVSADLVTPYPPGIPVLIPGQVITREIASFLLDLYQGSNGIEIHGMAEVDGEPQLRLAAPAPE